MKRLKSKHRLQKYFRAWRVFITQNVSLLFLILILVTGAFFGAWIFRILNSEHRLFISDLLYSPVVPSDFLSAMRAVVSSCFGHAVLLILLFLFGMTAFGCPLILLTLFFFGFRLGIVECLAYLSNGSFYTAVYVHVPLLIAAVALLIAVKCSLHMSCVFSRQLLPCGAHCGGMWMEFKRYLLLFAASFTTVVASSVTEILLQVLQSMI